MSGFNNIPPELRPNEELLELIAAEVSDWWNYNKEQMLALEKLYNETCTTDQFGFVHDKATKKIIAGSRLLWYRNMLSKEDI